MFKSNVICLKTISLVWGRQLLSSIKNLLNHKWLKLQIFYAKLTKQYIQKKKKIWKDVAWWLENKFSYGSRFNNYKSAHDISRIKNVVPKHVLKQKRFHGYFTAENYVGIENWVTTIIYYAENGKTIKQKELFWLTTENIRNLWPSWTGGSSCILKKENSFFLFLYCFTVL